MNLIYLLALIKSRITLLQAVVGSLPEKLRIDNQLDLKKKLKLWKVKLKLQLKQQHQAYLKAKAF